MKRLLVGATLATFVAVGGAALITTAPAGANPEPKVIVCKYVSNENAPSGEVFGQVIDVSANALDGFDPNLPFPQTFTDEQGTSVAVRYAEGPGDKGDEATDCDQPEATTTTSPPPAGGGGPAPCPGSFTKGPWYGDPRTNITLIGKGTFVVKGGVQRFSNTSTFTETLACKETFRIGRYKVENGHFLRIYQDGVLVLREKPPVLN